MLCLDIWWKHALKMEVLQTRKWLDLWRRRWGVVLKEGFWEEVAGVVIVEFSLQPQPGDGQPSTYCLGVVQTGSSGTEWKFRRIGERRKRRKCGGKERQRKQTENKGTNEKKSGSRSLCLTFFSPFLGGTLNLQSVQLFATPWTIQSMEFSGPEHWSG